MTKQDNIIKGLRKRKSEADRILRIRTRLDEYKAALRARKLKHNEHYYACTWDDVEFLLDVIENHAS
jgi:hypothetical protein